MPTSARKSSIGGVRRGPQKAHIPYRGDNPEVGKKTGIAVGHTHVGSDGFEPFEDLIQQADGRTPPRPKVRKKSLAMMGRHDEDYDEEDGEQSMQIESPVQNLLNMRPPTTPSTSGRRSSIRPVARTLDVDFDKVPSPRPASSAHKSARNGGPGPSSLSKSTRHREPTPESDSQDEGGGGDYSYGGGADMDQSGFDDYGPQEDGPSDQRSPRRSSFGRIEEDGEEEEQEEEQEAEEQEATPKPKNRQEKGKKRAEVVRPQSEEPQQDEEMEDEIAQGLEDVGLGPDSDASEEEPERPVKKTKVEAQKKTGRKQGTQSQSKKENKAHREGVRRSKRAHLAPLEYWRGEKYVYGRVDSSNGAPILVPQIREIVRVPKEHTLPLGGKRKRGSTRARSQSKSRGLADEDVIPPALPVANPEEGWDDETEAMCTVLSYTTKEEIERRIAYIAKKVEPRVAADGNWSFDKIFWDDNFIAAGQLIIPPRGRKPSKAAKDNTYVFYVIEGAVNLKIHETNMILATGGMFVVPRGNTYFIENICNRDARLFFTQARKVEMNDDEKIAKQQHDAETQKRRSMIRSSSAGAPSTGAKAAMPNGRAASLAVNSSHKS